MKTLRRVGFCLGMLAAFNIPVFAAGNVSNGHQITVTVDKTSVEVGGTVVASASCKCSTEPGTAPCSISWTSGSEGSNTLDATGTSDFTATCNGSVDNVSVTVVGVISIKYNGTDYTGGSIEVEKGEKGDTVSLTANSTPTGAAFPSGWPKWTNGPSVDTSTTGIKNVKVECGTSSVSFTVYVNHNAADDCKIDAKTPSKDKDWANCGSETIKISANSLTTDKDWKNGVKEDTNNINLGKTKYKAPDEWGSCYPEVGTSTNWTPPSGTNANTGTTNVNVIYDDNADTYTPRDDSSKSVEVQVGCFKVAVSLEVTGDFGNKSMKLDQDGTLTGTSDISMSEYFGYARAEATGTNNGPISENLEKFATGIFTFDVVPGTAVPNGKIKAKLSTSGSASMKVFAMDSDYWDGSVTLTFGASLGEGIALSAGVTVEFGSDTSESTACATSGFNSTDLGSSNPDTNKISVKSSEAGDNPISGINITREKLFSYSKSPVEMNKKAGDKVQGQYLFFGYAEAKHTSGWSGNDKSRSYATLGIPEIKFQVTDVSYVP